jgi:hypothetical protein
MERQLRPGERWPVEADEDDIINRLVTAHERHALDPDGELEPELELGLSLTEAEADALARITEALLAAPRSSNAERSLAKQILEGLAAQEWLR